MAPSASPTFASTTFPNSRASRSATTLRQFLKEICHTAYVHFPGLAPSADIPAAFGKQRKDWPDYELAFLNLMKKREIQNHVDPTVIKGGCLLCSEAMRHFCHRRLVVDDLQKHWGDLSVHHLD